MKYKVIKDTREKSGTWDFSLEDMNCEGMICKKINTGDYTLVGCESIFTIERKGCLAEFVGNIVDKRFMNEMDRLNKIKFAYLILEFDVTDIMRYPEGTRIPKHKWASLKIKSEFILSSILSLQYKYPNVKIMFVGRHGKEVAKTIFRKVIKYVEKNIPIR